MQEKAHIPQREFPTGNVQLDLLLDDITTLLASKCKGDIRSFAITRSGGTSTPVVEGGGDGRWGKITGTLSKQTDLWNVLSDHETRIEALEYVHIDITAFSGGSSNEKGATVTSVSFAWTITGSAAVASQTLTDTTLTAADRTKVLSGLTLTTNKTYTLVSTDTEAESDSATTAVAFYDKRHWGVSTNTSLTSAQILTLASNALASSRNMSATFDCTGGKYIFFAWPATWGTPTFTVNGLVDSSWVNATVSHTNASGYTSDYHTWRSLNLLNGASVSVVVT